MTSKQRRINIDATPWRHIDVETTLFQACLSTRMKPVSAGLSNNCNKDWKNNVGLYLVYLPYNRPTYHIIDQLTT